MNKTSISWVLGPDGAPGMTWNPFAGCRPASQGCMHCYAARLAATRLAHLQAYAGLAKSNQRHAQRRDGVVTSWTGEVRFFAEKLAEPLRRRKPTGIFVGDMGDIALLTNEQIAAIFGVMAACPQHRFYLLSKRPGRLRALFGTVERNRTVKWGKHAGERLPDVGWLEARVWQHWSQGIPGQQGKAYRLAEKMPWPLPNVWIGTSVCTQYDAEKNSPDLVQIPAAVHFWSVEPLLEEIVIRCPRCGGTGNDHNAGDGGGCSGDFPDLLICGGESGPRARPCRVDWIRSIVRQCREAWVPVFVKQMGSNCQARNDDNWTADEGDPDFPKWPDHLTGEDRIEDLPHGGYQGAPVRIHFRDRAGADIAEFPEDLRVREMPEGRP